MTRHSFARITFLGVGALLILLGCDRELLVGVRDHGRPPGGSTGSGGAIGPTGTGEGLVRDVALGWYHDCASLSDGSVRCWGVDNSAGELGDGTTVSHGDPHPVVGLAAATGVQSSYVYTCAQSGGTTSCWGSDYYGQLGDGKSGEGLIALVPTPAFGGAALTQVALGSSTPARCCPTRPWPVPA